MDFIYLFGAGLIVVALIVAYKYFDNEYKNKFPGL